MKRAPHMAVILAVVYLLLAFNAYACLIPLYGGIQVTQGSDCTMPQEQPARQHCDAFKALCVQAAPLTLQALDLSAHALTAAAPIAFQSFVFPHHPNVRPLSEPPPTEDILALTSVLRL